MCAGRGQGEDDVAGVPHALAHDARRAICYDIDLFQGSLFVIAGWRTFSSGVVFCALMLQRPHAICGRGESRRRKSHSAQGSHSSPPAHTDAARQPGRPDGSPRRERLVRREQRPSHHEVRAAVRLNRPHERPTLGAPIDRSKRGNSRGRSWARVGGRAGRVTGMPVARDKKESAPGPARSLAVVE